MRSRWLERDIVEAGRVFGEPLTEDQVRYALKVGRLPSAEREAA